MPALLRTFFLLIVLLASACTVHLAPPTTVYIVRHAEKDLTPGLADPALTTQGEQRALALRDTLLNRNIAAIFTTNTNRTRSTAAPLAAARNLTPEVYDAKQLPKLAARIRKDFAGRAVLVVGHSNTLLETVAALGAEKPMPAIGDEEYNYLLEVTIPQDTTKRPAAIARRYGVTK
ncbi:histidine phosphatase family protein [Hymenobacter sp. BT730]|uniref:histidine phosphatase family protein n=1 Tax=Hymenobacter sp. BT730 TaxID=3063332 RepID=UPI0026DEBB9B|nr:histidine phosphatase family protein [Hymenobacter sp. BT730]